jgi:imidazoleglycerol phosphate dehydratase HisB
VQFAASNWNGSKVDAGTLPATLQKLEDARRNAEATLHVTMHYGHNLHHVTEAVFKAVGRALAEATRLNPRIAGVLPSTKGTL